MRVVVSADATSLRATAATARRRAFRATDSIFSSKFFTTDRRENRFPNLHESSTNDSTPSRARATARDGSPSGAEGGGTIVHDGRRGPPVASRARSRRVFDAGAARRRSWFIRRAADAVGVRADLNMMKISPLSPVVRFFRISKASGISASRVRFTHGVLYVRNGPA